MSAVRSAEMPLAPLMVKPPTAETGPVSTLGQLRALQSEELDDNPELERGKSVINQHDYSVRSARLSRLDAWCRHWQYFNVDCQSCHYPRWTKARQSPLMIRLYDNTDSGNCYKIRLLLAQLGIPYESIELNTEDGETRTDEFLALNPNGRVPLLRTSSGRHLAESDAILWFLAENTVYLPIDRWERAQVLQWMFFEQYSHEPNIAVLRHWSRGGGHRKKPDQIEEKMRLGYAALDVMEARLAQAPFFAGAHYTIADIALYAYTHVAHQGGFSLDAHQHTTDWLHRVEAQGGYISMTERP